MFQDRLAGRPHGGPHGTPMGSYGTSWAPKGQRGPKVCPWHRGLCGWRFWCGQKKGGQRPLPWGSLLIRGGVLFPSHGYNTQPTKTKIIGQAFPISEVGGNAPQGAKQTPWALMGPPGRFSGPGPGRFKGPPWALKGPGRFNGSESPGPGPYLSFSDPALFTSSRPYETALMTPT